MTAKPPSYSRKKVVVIGGGNGSYIVGSGLRSRSVETTIISTPADSGGDSGDIRGEMGEMLPPGDMRRGMMALMDSQEADQLRQWFDHRLDVENPTKDRKRNVGNFIISSAIDRFGPIEGLQFLERVFKVQGRVLPMSIDDVHLFGRLDDGHILDEETKIDLRPLDDHRILTQVWLEPSAHICREAEQAILEADLITLGPGDLFTSIAPNLLVKGVNEVLRASKATIVAIPSLMTKWSETRDYQVHDFVHKMVELGIGDSKFDFAIVNTTVIPPDILKKYLEDEKSTPMLVRNRQELKKLKESAESIFPVDLLSKQGLRKGYVRHDPRKVAHALMDILDPSRSRLSVSDNSKDLMEMLKRLGDPALRDR